jgi:signal transduction histidine kinase
MESQLQRFLRTCEEPDALRREAFDLRRLVDEVLPLVRPAAQHAGVEIHWLRPAEELVVMGDPETLGQVVLNVVTNAIEAAAVVCTQGVGTSRKESGERRVVLALDQGDDLRAQLTISDTGPGPASAVSGSLFEPFVSDKPEGIGLGLATAREIVEAHGGRIEWSRSDAVTQFRIVLPTCVPTQSVGASRTGRVREGD